MGTVALIERATNIYQKIRRKLRIKEVNNDPLGAFADKFGEPEQLRDNSNLQPSSPSSELDEREKRHSDPQ